MSLLYERVPGFATLAAFALASSASGQVHSLISSNFNGTAIGAGRTIWFNSVLDPTLPSVSGDVSIWMTGSKVRFAAGGTNYTLNLPDSKVTFSSTATSASTLFNSGANRWETLLPKSYSGNTWLGGGGMVLSTALPGGINPVTWEGDFSASVEGVSFKWKWAAAVYTGSPSSWPSSYNDLQVKPVDDKNLSAYKNSDHAGTPEAFKSQVIGGARGGGGSNYTGSYSGTKSVSAPVPEPFTLGLAGLGLAAALRRRLRR